jgi:hypothetical protein
MTQQFHGADLRYSVTRDPETSAWRILDTKHPALAQLMPSSEVPSEAFKIITEGEFIALVQEAASLEYVSPLQLNPNFNLGGPTQDNIGNVNLLGVVDEEVLNELKAQLAEAHRNALTSDKELLQARADLAAARAEQNRVPESESYKLRIHAIDKIMGITAVDAVDKD